jgi:hypothetical protein
VGRSGDGLGGSSLSLFIEYRDDPLRARSGLGYVDVDVAAGADFWLFRRASGGGGGFFELLDGFVGAASICSGDSGSSNLPKSSNLCIWAAKFSLTRSDSVLVSVLDSVRKDLGLGGGGGIFASFAIEALSCSDDDRGVASVGRAIESSVEGCVDAVSVLEALSFPAGSVLLGPVASAPP